MLRQAGRICSWNN